MIRLYIRPIDNRRSGEWIEAVDAEGIREYVQDQRQKHGVEEFRIVNAEGLPSRLIPQHGGIPYDKIQGFLDVADHRGVPAARAYVEALDLVGMLEDHPPEEWVRSFRNSHTGVQDSMTEWTWILAEQGYFSRGVQQVISEENERYLDIDYLRNMMEQDSYCFGTFVEESDGVHRFHTNEITTI